MSVAATSRTLSSTPDHAWFSDILSHPFAIGLGWTALSVGVYTVFAQLVMCSDASVV